MLKNSNDNHIKNASLIFTFFLSSFLISAYDLSTYDFLETPALPEYNLSEKTQPTQSSFLLPLCFASHMLEKVAYVATGYVIFDSCLQLKKDLENINQKSYWPFSWFGKASSYGHCSLTIALALAKIYLIRYCTQIMIHVTCPNELCSRHQHQCQTTQVLITST